MSTSIIKSYTPLFTQLYSVISYCLCHQFVALQRANFWLIPLIPDTRNGKRGSCEKTLKCRKLSYSENDKVMRDSIQFTFVKLFVPPFSLYSVSLLLLLCCKLISVPLVYLSPTPAELSKRIMFIVHMIRVRRQKKREMPAPPI